MRTMFPQETETSGDSDTALTQETAESEAKVKFPKHIKHRGKTLATIYGKSTGKTGYPLYRVAWTVAGKRQMKSFERYGDAKKHADSLVRDLAKGSQVAALTPRQATDALAAIERLPAWFRRRRRG